MIKFGSPTTQNVTQDIIKEDETTAQANENVKKEETSKTNTLLGKKILRKDGRGCFFEVVTNSFGLCSLKGDEKKDMDGKVQFNFAAYDQASHKQTAFVPFYLDMTKFDELLGIVENGWILTLEEEARASAKNGYPAPVFQVNGGSTSGECIARLFKVIPASKQEHHFVVQVDKGKGEVTKEGLIRFAQKPDTTIRIPLSYGELLGTLKFISRSIQSYIDRTSIPQ